MATTTAVTESPRSSSTQELNRAVGELDVARVSLNKLTNTERIALAEECFRGVVTEAHNWIDAASHAKRIPEGSGLRAEEVASGPASLLRFIRLLQQTLRDLDRHGKPQLPGKVRTDATGRLRVPVFPARGFYDQLLFFRLKAEARMQADATPDDLFQLPPQTDAPAPIATVLGAGNVSSIPATDALSKLFFEHRLVLLKMNPVNDYLGPIFERIFAPLIRKDFLKIVYGGADVGSAAINHHLVDEVHITGSIHSHDAIVWGPNPEEQADRKHRGEPLLDKRMTSELGNVSPWIIVPGKYSKRQLKFQAEYVATSIANNCSFNCIATKVLITSKQWSQREEFLGLLDKTLASIPRRYAYYPGADDRFERFTQQSLPENHDGYLPWTLLRDVDPAQRPLCFEEESFVCVTAETAIDEADPARFLARATEFANENCWGTLCATLTVPSGFRNSSATRPAYEQAIADLEYAAIGVNNWPALLYAIMTPPWGGYPGKPLDDVQSGTGWVHNTYLLKGVEKTILTGPLTIFPKPFWFATCKNPEPVAWKLFEIYRKTSLLNLNSLLNRATIAGLGM